MNRVISSIAAVAAIGSGIALMYIINITPERPDLDMEKWWGIGLRPREEETAIKPFTIHFNDTKRVTFVCYSFLLLSQREKLLVFMKSLEDLVRRRIFTFISNFQMVNDLKQRLRARRPYTKSLEGMQSEYGLNTVFLDSVITHWIDRYDFKARAELLNQFPHYKTRIQGLDIHFMWVKPEIRNVKKLPLLMLHGWPSSSREFIKVIPVLTQRREGYEFVFDVVAADLPGFGFSQGTNKPGLNPVQIGIMMKNLMSRLGYDKFYIHAGDWGSQCATHMATLFPDDILGFHTNMPLSSKRISMLKLILGSAFPSLIVDRQYRNRLYPLGTLFSYLWRESGYFHIQSTKPDTVGVALNDSPVGLAAYLIEKMGVVSNHDQINTPHSGAANLHIEDLLDTVTIVWSNNCIVTSSRLYYEGVNSPEVYTVHEIPTPVPTAAIKFRYEVVYQPDKLLRDKFINLVRSTTPEVGGHFAALQTPQLLIDDIWQSAKAFLEFNAARHIAGMPI